MNRIPMQVRRLLAMLVVAGPIAALPSWGPPAGAAVAVALAPPSAVFDKSSARWGSKKLNVESLPDDLSEGARESVERWSEWARELGYHLLLSKDQRVIVLGPKKGSSLKKYGGLLEEATASFDAMIASTAVAEGGVREASSNAEAGDRGAASSDPENDVYDPFGGLSPDEPAAAPEVAPTLWGDGAFVPDAVPAVMIVVKDQDDYDHLLHDIAKRDPELREWTNDAKTDGGFVRLRPPVGVLVLSKGHEEWDPDNEIANRAGRLLLSRRFGPRLPFWLLQGFAWRIEQEVRGTLYCFPYRNDFVGVGEHTSWGTELSNMFRDKDRSDRPLSVEDFAHWKRGSFVERYARISWGLTSWLAMEDSAALTAYIDDLREFSDENNRRQLGGGKWERIDGYEIPIATQKTLLEKHYGADVWDRATEAFKRRKVK